VNYQKAAFNLSCRSLVSLSLSFELCHKNKTLNFVYVDRSSIPGCVASQTIRKTLFTMFFHSYVNLSVQMISLELHPNDLLKLKYLINHINICQNIRTN